MMEVVEDRRSHIAARIAANKNVLDMLLEQAQVGGLDDGLRFQIKRTRQDIRNSKAMLTKLDARHARSLQQNGF
jgi:hypothetical protein